MTALSNAEIVDVFLAIRPKLERIIGHRTNCHHTAQDLVQDLYFKVLRIAHELPSDDDARRYLIRMAINAANDHTRVEGRRAEILLGNLGLFENYASGPYDSVLTDEQLAIIATALKSLPEKCFDVLYLSRIEGLTHAEIAQKLGVSRSLVEKYIVRALIQCRASLRAAEGGE